VSGTRKVVARCRALGEGDFAATRLATLP
jgi:hypothetical protein